MTPVIINTETTEIVYEGMDYLDCIDTVRDHFVGIMPFGKKREALLMKYRVGDGDTMELLSAEQIRDILNVRRSVRSMLNYGG